MKPFEAVKGAGFEVAVSEDMATWGTLEGDIASGTISQALLDAR